jgi:hypothetical protein
MSRSIKRNDYTYWYNDEPITDIHEALSVLACEQTSSTPLYLAHGRESVNGGYEIVVHWHSHRGYGSDGVEYYQIDQALAQKLVDEQFVIPRRILHMGYTETRKEQLVLSDAAREKLEAYEKEMEKKAVSMLVPGIHTDLTGTPKRTSWRRDGFRHGKLYFEYELPGERGSVRVYPEEDRLVMPEEKQAQST